MSMHLRHALATLVAASALAAAPTALAAELKIGFVNYQKLVQESPQARVANSALETEFAPRQREIVAQQKALKDKEEKLQRDSAVMSEAERAKAERELRDGERDVARRINEFQEDVNVRRNEEFGKVNRALLGEVQVYAKANGYDLILSEGVVFASEGIDVTAQVLAALKAKGPAAPAAARPAQQPAPKPKN
ncbi:MAG: OmpH family outer membrane protein [Steroidobacteraceae bacterium]|nr:OmpH family outer membrane protein [Steroidobacteraceae bacterium]